MLLLERGIRLDSFDKKFLELLNTKSTLDWLKKQNAELREAAFKNYHHVLLKRWLLTIVLLFVGGSIGLALGLIAGTNSSTSGLPIGTAFLDNLAKTLIAPSVTINGLFITFMPVICFFFLSQFKEMEKESQVDIEELRKNVAYEEAEIEELQIRSKYEHVFFHNFRSGIINYLRTYVTLALFSLIFLIIVYVTLSSVFFLFFDIVVLASLLTGIAPIITVVLNESTLRPITIFFKEGKKEIITNL
jgi:hypothetical protein